MKKFNSQIIWVVVMIGVAVATRTVLHLGANFEWITALTVVAAMKLRGRYALAVPVLSVMISDILIGNDAIFIFTWSGFAMMFVTTWLCRSRLNDLSVIGRYTGATAIAVANVLLFYFWTNLGVVLVGKLYVISFTGYVQSLYMALPFLQNQLLSAVIATPAVLAVYETAKRQFYTIRLKHL